MSVCMFVCLTPISGGHGDFCSKNLFLILAYDDPIFPKKYSVFLLFPRLSKCAVLDQPTVDSGGVSREMSVDLAVGCWLYCIVVSIRIGGEIQCLTCAVFLTDPVLQTPLSLIHSFINSVTQSSFSSKSSKYHKSQTIKARELTFL